MNPRAQRYSCACLLKFWNFFSWALATLFKIPLIGHKGILMGSYLGEGLLVGFELDNFWATGDSSWKPIPIIENLWETQEYTTEEGTVLEGRTTNSISDQPPSVQWFDESIECSVPRLARQAPIGACWTPATSPLLFSTDPPLQSAPCFSKTPQKTTVFTGPVPKMPVTIRLTFNPSTMIHTKTQSTTNKAKERKPLHLKTRTELKMEDPYSQIYKP